MGMWRTAASQPPEIGAPTRTLVTGGRLNPAQVTVSDPDEARKIYARERGEWTQISETKKLKRLVRLCKKGQGTPEMLAAVLAIYGSRGQRAPLGPD